MNISVIITKLLNVHVCILVLTSISVAVRIAPRAHACVSVTHMRAEPERNMYFLPSENVRISLSGRKVRPFRHISPSRVS